MAKAGLSATHLKALELLSEGLKSRQEIANICGFTNDHLKHLISGTTVTGVTGQMFKTEYQRIMSKKIEESRILAKENRALLMYKINQRLRKLMPKSPTQKMTMELVSVLNALSKAASPVEVQGGVHTHYHLTREERSNEFRRLLGAVQPYLRRSIRKPAGGGTDQSSVDLGAGGSLSSESEA